jgi:hypothetical protein
MFFGFRGLVLEREGSKTGPGEEDEESRQVSVEVRP